jgi:hypothetical protein
VVFVLSRDGAHQHERPRWDNFLSGFCLLHSALSRIPLVHASLKDGRHRSLSRKDGESVAIGFLGVVHAFWTCGSWCCAVLAWLGLGLGEGLGLKTQVGHFLSHLDWGTSIGVCSDVHVVAPHSWWGL